MRIYRSPAQLAASFIQRSFCFCNGTIGASAHFQSKGGVIPPPEIPHHPPSPQRIGGYFFGTVGGFNGPFAPEASCPLAHLGLGAGNRLPAQPKNTSRFPPALAIIENKLPNRRVNLHHEHPFGFPSSRRQRNALPLAGFYSAAAANIAAAPVADYSTAVDTTPYRMEFSERIGFQSTQKGTAMVPDPPDQCMARPPSTLIV
jgi:hypothetical protein